MKCNINGRKNIISPIIPPIIKPTVLFLTPGNPKLKTSIPPTKIAITARQHRAANRKKKAYSIPIVKLTISKMITKPTDGTQWGNS